ncbi:glycosyltransferase [Flavobacterium sp. NG2]|uniref:glycosyltransferase n=1 Tax=Flavobacterium sp. NG2 TaxID=3097547 RepID=UPI002A81CD15|nr:glycosyltransferase [Flavobacterium sp. NG2]WPR70199.1 glycosyltransferase [Flavobacterium sp. NG2]
MPNHPLVTVICLCYNHEDFVIESLNSVINQTYPNIELIIVDDCSTDNSKLKIKKWLTSYPKAIFIENQTNIENTKSFNKGLKQAKGEYIIDLAADDVLLPNCVTAQVNAFSTSMYKNVGVVYGNAELISENGKFESYYFPTNSDRKVIQKRKTGDIYENVISDFYCMCSVSAMIKKSVFNHLGGYDEALAYEDLDFWIRASRYYDFDFIDEPIMQKRILPNSLGTNFSKSKNSRTRKFDQTTYLILKKGIKLNRTKEEDLGIQKRVHHGIVQCLKNKNYFLMLKNIQLRLILAWRKNFKKY